MVAGRKLGSAPEMFPGDPIVRPPPVVWAYWKEVLVIPEDAILMNPVYL